MNDRWHRLSPLSPVVYLGRGVIGVVIIVIPALIVQGGGTLSFFEFYVLTALSVLSGFVSWLVTRWRIQGTVLEKEEGLIRRRSLRFPLAQVQAIDVIRPGIARALGLAELRLRMGGSTHTAGRLAYLRMNQATELRVRLLELAAWSREGTVAAIARPEGEQVLTTTPTARLFGSLVLSDGSIRLLVVLVPAVVYFGLRGSAAYVLLAGAGLWARFNGEYRLTVAEGPDGLRVRGGLVATIAETIPRGRVQAVRTIEPILWRPFGWCRLQVEIAGHQQAKREASAESGRAHTLLPVGNRRQVNELLLHLLLELPSQRLRPPRRARWKTPLRFHNLAWGRTDGCVVTTSGRLTRRTVWVPLAKAQSLRLVRGPVQKSFRLATIHVDVAGRGVRAALRDRDEAEAEEVLAKLVSLSRHARQASSIKSRTA